MTGLDIGLAAVALGCLGLAVNRWVLLRRWRREYADQERQTRVLHQRHDVERERHARLSEQVLELAPAIRDAQRRYGFRLGPEIATLVAEVSCDRDSWWLMTHAPGFHRLSDGERATDQFAGRTAVAALPEPAPKPRRRRPRALPEASSDIPGRGPDGAIAEPSGPRLAGGAAT